MRVMKWRLIEENGRGRHAAPIPNNIEQLQEEEEEKTKITKQLQKVIIFKWPLVARPKGQYCYYGDYALQKYLLSDIHETIPKDVINKEEAEEYSSVDQRVVKTSQHHGGLSALNINKWSHMVPWSRTIFFG
jgi:3'-phosphoadenosine 5'-phosphosulfate (PAPS) 3'-phosphatase